MMPIVCLRTCRKRVEEDWMVEGGGEEVIIMVY